MLELNIAAYHQLLLEGRLTSETLVAFYLDRIQRFDGILASIICVNPVAMELARECDRSLRGAGRLSGSLHGVPVLLKDNIETKDMPTTAGSLSLEGFSTGKDADLVKRLKAAGAIILAKTNLHEFAIWGESISSIKGQTLNPYDLTRTPGVPAAAPGLPWQPILAWSGSEPTPSIPSALHPAPTIWSGSDLQSAWSAMRALCPILLRRTQPDRWPVLLRMPLLY